MTIAATHLITNGSSTDSTTTYTTATVTYDPNDLVLCWVATRAGADHGTDPVLTGASGTWDFVARQATSITGVGYIRLYRCQNTTGGSGAVTITVSGVGVTITACLWSFVKYTNCARGANGANALAQTKVVVENTSNATLTATFDNAFKSSLNATTGGMALHLNEAINHDSGGGYSELGDAGTTTPVNRIETQFLASNDTTVTWTWSTNQGAKAAIAAELRHDWPAGTLHGARSARLQAVNRGVF